jgi:hypothetical protein
VIDGASLEMVLSSNAAAEVQQVPENDSSPTSPDVLSTSSQRPMIVEVLFHFFKF